MSRRSKGNRTGKKRKASAAFKKAGESWRDHIKKTMRENPSMKFGKSLLKLASKTYKKGSAVEDTISNSRLTSRRTGRRTTPTRPKKRTKKRTKKLKKRSLFGF